MVGCQTPKSTVDEVNLASTLDYNNFLFLKEINKGVNKLKNSIDERGRKPQELRLLTSAQKMVQNLQQVISITKDSTSDKKLIIPLLNSIFDATNFFEKEFRITPRNTLPNSSEILSAYQQYINYPTILNQHHFIHLSISKTLVLLNEHCSMVGASTWNFCPQISHSHKTDSIQVKDYKHTIVLYPKEHCFPNNSVTFSDFKATIPIHDIHTEIVNNACIVTFNTNQKNKFHFYSKVSATNGAIELNFDCTIVVSFLDKE